MYIYIQYMHKSVYVNYGHVVQYTFLTLCGLVREDDAITLEVT